MAREERLSVLMGMVALRAYLDGNDEELELVRNSYDYGQIEYALLGTSVGLLCYLEDELALDLIEDLRSSPLLTPEGLPHLAIAEEVVRGGSGWISTGGGPMSPEAFDTILQTSFALSSGVARYAQVDLDAFLKDIHDFALHSTE